MKRSWKVILPHFNDGTRITGIHCQLIFPQTSMVAFLEAPSVLFRQRLLLLILTIFFTAKLTVLHQGKQGVTDGSILRKDQANGHPTKKVTLQSSAGANETEKAMLVSTSQNSTLSRKLPTLFLAGAQKAGTTATWGFIFQNHLVCGAANTTKEPHFFDSYDFQSKSLDDYTSLFEHCDDESLIIDATPRNLLEASRIRKFYEKAGMEVADDIKIMISLREPVARDISWYHHLLRAYVTNDTEAVAYFMSDFVDQRKNRPKTFAEYMQSNILPDFESDAGNYARWLKQWFQLFPRQNILLMSYHEFHRDPSKFLGRILQFLDIAVTGPLEAPHENSLHVVEEPIPCTVQEMLAGMYAAKNQELYTLLRDNPGPSMELQPFPEFNFTCS